MPLPKVLPPLAALIVLGASGAARGQGVALSLDGAPAGDRGWLVQSPDARGERTLRFRVGAEYAREPLVLSTASGHFNRMVIDQLWGHASVSLALAHRWLFAVGAPVLLHQTSRARFDDGPAPPAPASAPAFGDVRLTVRARALGPAGPGWQLGLGGEVWLPVGSEAAYAGDGAVRARGFVSAGATFERGYVAFEAGFLGRAAERLPGALPLRVGSAVTAGASAGFAVDARRTVHVGPEIAGQFVVGQGARWLDPRSTLVQVLFGLRWRVGGGPIDLGAAGGPGIAAGAGAADYRVLASVVWTPEQRPPPPDQDDDGVPDATDVCPNLRGVHSSDPLMDGCPALPPDADGDSIPDEFDACVHTPGEATGVRKTNGCPKPIDADHDAVPDAEDACPSVPGIRDPDRAKNGCPAPQASLVNESIVISEQVQFETGTAALRGESDALLGQVARVLAEHAEIELVEVQGHTDDVGSEEHDRRLSQERAEAVVAWLRGHGVAAARLVARGYGRARPLSDNATDEGRAKNRRVEFRVVRARQGGPP